MKRENDMVTASEIASWAWCPESWRLSALGHEPENQEEMSRGEKRQGRTILVERLSALAVKLGWWLLVAAMFLAVLVLVRG